MTRRRFSREFKLEAVRLVREQNLSIKTKGVGVT
jgi:transposase-like protein